ncbi:hypothetical protein CEY02_17015 [Bacillus pumilus]|uniref:Uncharacterized protein n=1 Tax=Bacillus pumilus TaxID=1408 RepID=A0A2A5ISJ4_BACPU|nr:hypothetical protein CEY02_17015 [Bacillus pumilus]
MDHPSHIYLLMKNFVKKAKNGDVIHRKDVCFQAVLFKKTNHQETDCTIRLDILKFMGFCFISCYESILLGVF